MTPAVIALMILGAVALALIGAALYGFFGHPTSRVGKKRKLQGVAFASLEASCWGFS